MNVKCGKIIYVAVGVGTLLIHFIFIASRCSVQYEEVVSEEHGKPFTTPLYSRAAHKVSHFLGTKKDSLLVVAVVSHLLGTEKKILYWWWW